MSLANGIDSYLAGRGSPMAGQGKAFVQAGKRYGVDPRLLVGIATIESGAGANMRLPYNPFNYGVHRGQEYGSYGEAINDVARGLRRNYLDSGLTTPQQIVSKYAPAADNNDEGNWASVVSEVMGKLGGKGAIPTGIPHPPHLAAPARPTLPAPPPGPPVLNRQAFGNAMLQQFATGGGRVDINALPGLQQTFYETPKLPKAPKGVPEAGVAPIGAVMPSDNVGAQAVKQAATQLGDPYVFGASSAGRDPSSFDCSSLVQWAYRQVGIDIPRDTYGQQRVLKQKSWKDLQPGDPIYRRSGGHVVIYAGNGRVIAAPHTGTNVQYQPLSQFPQSEYVPYNIPHGR